MVDGWCGSPGGLNNFSRGEAGWTRTTKNEDGIGVNQATKYKLVEEFSLGISFLIDC